MINETEFQCPFAAAKMRHISILKWFKQKSWGCISHSRQISKYDHIIPNRYLSTVQYRSLFCRMHIRLFVPLKVIIPIKFELIRDEFNGFFLGPVRVDFIQDEWDYICDSSWKDCHWQFHFHQQFKEFWNAFPDSPFRFFSNFLRTPIRESLSKVIPEWGFYERHTFYILRFPI